MTITLNPTEIQYEEDLYDQNSDQEMSEKETAEEDVAEDHFVVDVLEDSSPIITGQDSLVEDPHSKWLGFLLGISLAFISGLIFTGNNVVIQMLHCDYSDTLLIRSLVQVLVIGSICKIKGLSLWPKIGPNPTKLRALIVFQGIFGALLIILGFSCVLFMPLGDALTLIFSAPLSTMCTAAIFLGQQLRLFKITCGVMLVIGTVLVIKPPFIFNPDLDDIDDTVDRSSHNNNRSTVTSFYSSLYHQDKHDSLYFIGVIIALSSAMADGFLNVAINFCKEVNSLVLLWWAGMGGLVVSFISSTFDDQESILHYSDIVNIGVEHWLAFFGMACVGIFSYFCMTKSLQMIDPTIVAFVRALEIVFAYIAQIAIMHQLPDSYAIIGGSCVLVSVLAMAIQTKITALIPEKIRFLF